MFDSHAHYDDARFDGDRDALLAALFADGGVSHIVNAATDLPSARACRGPARIPVRGVISAPVLRLRPVQP